MTANTRKEPEQGPHASAGRPFSFGSSCHPVPMERGSPPLPIVLVLQKHHCMYCGIIAAFIIISKFVFQYFLCVLSLNA